MTRRTNASVAGFTFLVYMAATIASVVLFTRATGGERVAAQLAGIHGPYDALVKTTAALLDWGKEKKLKWQVAGEGKVTRWSARVEHYLVGPPEEANPKNWRTEIAILVAGDQA